MKINKEDKIMTERKNLWVCERCLWAIESREGNQPTLKHNIDEVDEVDEVDDTNSKCDWCEETGFLELYELI